MGPFRLGILTALWRRPRVAEAVLRHYVRLDVEGVKLVPMAVQSPEDPDGITAGPCHFWAGTNMVSAPNDPLSEKWNAGMRALRKHNVDAVMVVGSDDCASAAYIADAVAAVRDGAHLVHAQECAFLDLPNAGEVRACYARPRRLGGGRTLSRRILDATHWEPWPTGLNIRLDGGMDKRLLRAGLLGEPKADRMIEWDAGKPPQLLAIKTEHPNGDTANLWGYDALESCHVEDIAPDDLHALLRDHFPTVLELMPEAVAA